MNVAKRFEIIFLSGLIFLFIVATNSCNDPSNIGSELLDEDLLEVEFTDTFTVVANTVQGVDSLLTYDQFTTTLNLFAGEINDPFFGTVTHDAYFLPGLGATVPSFFDEDNQQFVTVDSVVMIVSIDTSLYYGDIDATHNVDVFLLEDEVDFDGEYYTNMDFPTQMTPVGEDIQFNVSFDPFTASFDGDTISTDPAIRLKLDNSLGELLVMDTAAVQSDTLLRKIMPGFKIVNRPDVTGVLPLNLGTRTLVDISNKLIVYYTDTIPKLYSFPLGGVRHNTSQRDFTGTALEESINNPSDSQELVYTQGYGGADVRLEFPTARFEALGDVLLKKAELEVTVAPIEGDDDEVFQPIQLLFIDSEDPDTGERERVVDLVNASLGATIELGFGGTLTEELDEDGQFIRNYYTYNLTSYFQSLLEENTVETGVLFLEAASPILIVGRSILFGPGSETFPMKLKLTYSIPN